MSGRRPYGRGRFDRITLKFHAAAYAVAAAIVADLIACAADGLLADPGGSWRPVAPLGIGVTLVAGGFKLLWEDLQFDEPVALFIALGAYSGALLATPRLMRKGAQRGQGA